MAKSLDLSSITIKKIIVHDIPRHRYEEEGIEPSYSEGESELTDGLKFFFKDKIVQALSSDKSFRICFQEEHTSPISWLTSEILEGDNKDFVNPSKAIAKHLFDIQGGVNAAGIFLKVKNSGLKHSLKIHN